MKVSKKFVLEAHEHACSEWKEKIEKEFPKLFNETYKTGDRFELLDFDHTYILARLESKEVNLISLENGNRWSDNVKVSDPYFITKKELNKLFKAYNFKKI